MSQENPTMWPRQPAYNLCLNLVIVLCVLTSSPVTYGRKIRTTSAVADCHPRDAPLFSNPQLHSMLPKSPVSGSHLAICTSENSCCTAEMEQQLLQTVRKDFRALLSHNSRSVEGLLDTTAQALRDHIVELSIRNRNKTLSNFRTIYQDMSILATEAVHKFYSDVVRYATTTDQFEVEGSVVEFFIDIFPLVYHNIVHPQLRDYSDHYKRCLRTFVQEIQPFDNVPTVLMSQIKHTLSAVRVFLEALRVGADALNQTDTLFDANTDEKCHRELVRLSYCPKCRGVTSKPCAGYCLNVLRGCLTHFSVLLDLPWNGFVESLQELVSRKSIISSTKSQLLANIDDVIKNIDYKISEGIMHAMKQEKHLEEQVKKSCGAPQWSDDDGQPLPPDHVASAENLYDLKGSSSFSSNMRFYDLLRDYDKQISQQLRDFLVSISKTKGFYGNMAESLCSDESYAETRDTADCWNGHRVGEYTKTVVAADVNAQKYNPELSYTDNTIKDAEVRGLSEQLRRMRLAITGLLSSTPESESFMRDEEGSGDSSHYVPDGYPKDDEDGDQNLEDVEGSGSGSGPIDSENPTQTFRGTNITTGNVGISAGPTLSTFSMSMLTLSAIVLPRYFMSQL